MRLEGHGSCNYHSQVQVSGQAVAVFFSHDAPWSGTGLHVAQHASTDALWLGVVDQSRVPGWLGT